MATLEEIRKKIRDTENRINEHATILRNDLEELSELTRTLWEYDEDYCLPDGQVKETDDLQDMADDVSVIEQMFERNQQ